MQLKVGQKAPEFFLPDQTGKERCLSDYRGHWVLLYFYPKDNTPGCTKEASAMRDHAGDFKKQKAIVLGVSTDSIKSHQKFAEKFALTFPLLADEKKEVVKQYGVWRQKQLMGRKYMGTSRVSFLIDPEGKIAKIYEQVKPEEHAAEVLADVI